ncbi:unnamed protein product [Brassica oleracea]
MSAMMESLWEWICSYWILTRSSLPSKKLWSRTKNSHLTLSALPMSQSRRPVSTVAMLFDDNQ